MAKPSSQKFIGRNRPPRVQIEYDVEIYGAEKKVQLPFVTGVMADLSGQPAKPLPPVVERDFLEIDIDNFDERMKAIQPRVLTHVTNTLTGEGQLALDMTFESMGDFAPDAIALKVEPLRQLLETRQQLMHLMSYLDGKPKGEDLVSQLLNTPALLQRISAQPAAVTSSHDAREQE